MPSSEARKRSVITEFHEITQVNKIAQAQSKGLPNDLPIQMNSLLVYSGISNNVSMSVLKDDGSIKNVKSW